MVPEVRLRKVQVVIWKCGMSIRLIILKKYLFLLMNIIQEMERLTKKQELELQVSLILKQEKQTAKEQEFIFYQVENLLKNLKNLILNIYNPILLKKERYSLKLPEVFL